MPAIYRVTARDMAKEIGSLLNVTEEKVLVTVFNTSTVFLTASAASIALASVSGAFTFLMMGLFLRAITVKETEEDGAVVELFGHIVWKEIKPKE
jgi:hypothetical protein